MSPGPHPPRQRLVQVLVPAATDAVAVIAACSCGFRTIFEGDIYQDIVYKDVVCKDVVYKDVVRKNVIFRISLNEYCARLGVDGDNQKCMLKQHELLIIKCLWADGRKLSK